MPLTSDTGVLSIAEWGWNVAADHTVRGKRVTLHDGSQCTDQGVWTALKTIRTKFKNFHPTEDSLLCFTGTAPGGAAAVRIFFDASSFWNLPSRGWEVAGKPAPV
jgi:hypothetical protein